MTKRLLLIAGLLLLFFGEILNVYFIMPFPGSQRSDTIDTAYFLHNNLWWIRCIGLALIAYPLYRIFTKGKVRSKMIAGIALLLYAVIFYLFNFRFLADKMFYQPKQKQMATVIKNAVDQDKLVLSIHINGEAKAYPIMVIGYHHQVKDTVGGEPVMVTYCTVCRTGRAFSPFIKGQYQQFRLVGMDHFNAMFEDENTKSWWRQATGEAIAGPQKGNVLNELPSEQMELQAWIRKYPDTKILQPDSSFTKKYEQLEDFDMGTIDSHLEKRDSASWQFKSWVVGVLINAKAKAYDWNDLLQYKLINDSLNAVPLVLVVEKDSASFHAWNRTVNGRVLDFMVNENDDIIKDINTGSSWNMDGLCIEGELKGQQLAVVPAYQEFWHSWQQFRPGTTKYLAGK